MLHITQDSVTIIQSMSHSTAFSLHGDMQCSECLNFFCSWAFTALLWTFHCPLTLKSAGRNKHAVKNNNYQNKN